MKKEIKYHEISIEGFQSVCKPIIFQLDRGAGITLIKGTNGVGKTTFFNAIWWAEYGDNMKKSVTTWQDLRTETFRGTRVIIKRSIGDKDYMIARHSGFKGTTKSIKCEDGILVFEKSNTEKEFLPTHLIDAKYKADAQLEINKQLGINSNVFMNSIMFGQKMQKLIEADNKDKRELFEELFNLTFVDDALETAKQKVVDLKTEEITLQNSLQTKENTINRLNTSIEDLALKSEEYDTKSKEEISLMEKSISDLKETTLKIQKEEVLEKEKSVKQKELELEKLSKLKDDYYKIKLDFEKTEQEAEESKKEVQNANTELTTQLEKIKSSKIIALQEYDDKGQGHLADAKKKLKDLESSISEYQKSIEKEQEKKERNLQEIENINPICPTCEEPINEAKIEKAKKNLKQLNKSIDEIITSTQSLKRKQEQELEPLKDKIKAFEIEINNTETKLQEEKSKDILTYLSEVEQTYNARLKTAKSLHDKNVQASEEAQKTFNQAKESYSEYEKTERALMDLKMEVATLIERAIGTERLLEERENNLKLLKEKEKPDFSTEKLELEIEELDKDCLEIKTKLEKAVKDITNFEWWIKKGFSAGGLKAYVFQSMLQKLNVYCANYYEQLKFRVEFSVDLSKASKPFTTLIYSADKTRDYLDLSGGQKQRVDICIAFAMHDLITEKADFNILALDEIFEGMDAEGIETAFELIRLKAERHSVYLVTHNDIIDSLYCKTIELGLDKDRHTYVKN